MKRFVAFAVLCCLLSPSLPGQRRRQAGASGPDPVAEFGKPLPGLTRGQLERFVAGREEFLRVRRVDNGLGPVFNAAFCASCHNRPATGGASGGVETRIGTITNNQFDPLKHLGGPIISRRSIGEMDGAVHTYRAEAVPPEATINASRRSIPLFGLGLIDATPDSTFIALAAEQAARGDGTAGRVAWVDNPAAGTQTVGKFGWKNQNPTLFRFAGDAYLNEMGITNPEFPDEDCPSGRCEELRFNPAPGLNDDGSGVRALTEFMMFLAAPPRGPITAEVTAGEAVFNQIGCNSCHVSTLQTGPHPVRALDRVTYHPYSDFLLHHMDDLRDGIPQGAATGNEFRTPPLWGLRAITGFLHDNSARTIEDAIIAHDGQGFPAKDRFRKLSPGDRARLLAFLQSL